MTFSWADAKRNLVDKDVLRATLQLEAVVFHELGVTLDEYGRANCPFHDDANPSFALFEGEDGVERVGCWACDWRGDVFDVIRVARNVGFNEAVREATLLIDLPRVARRETRETVDPVVLQDKVDACRRRAENDANPIRRLVTAKGIRAVVPWLLSEWQLGVYSTVGAGLVCIPHLDKVGQVIGFKVRSPSSPTIASKGAKFSELYGVWRDEGQRRVVLCEGESDTWTAASTADDDSILALGLPTGANTPVRSDWVSLLADREVRLLFDPDKAGLDAQSRWENVLRERCVKVWQTLLPDGKDLTDQPLETQRWAVNGDWE